MAAIYIREQGAVIAKSDRRILVKKQGETILERPIISLDSIAVFGNVNITAQAAVLLMENGIDVCFFTYGGRYVGHLAADRSKNIFLRMAQGGYYRDDGLRLSLAKKIVKNKIENQQAVIKGYRWDASYSWQRDIESMEKLVLRLDAMETTDAIMGIEGAASNIYFKAYAQMFKGEIHFPGRNRRPPKDPINIILSLGYTLLTHEVEAALEAHSFEMYLGFLHGIRYGRKSLPLDMVEEFRQPVVDRLALRLFNKGMLSRYDFEDNGSSPPMLSEEGFRKFCRSYEIWLAGQDKETGENSFRHRIQQQAAELKAAIREKREYRPYAWKSVQEREAVGCPGKTDDSKIGTG